MIVLIEDINGHVAGQFEVNSPFTNEYITGNVSFGDRTVAFVQAKIRYVSDEVAIYRMQGL